MSPSTSPTQSSSDASIQAEEPSEAADLINRPRMPDLDEFDATADHIIAARYYGAHGLIDGPTSERAQLCKILSGGSAGRGSCEICWAPKIHRWKVKS